MENNAEIGFHKEMGKSSYAMCLDSKLYNPS